MNTQLSSVWQRTFTQAVTAIKLNLHVLFLSRRMTLSLNRCYLSTSGTLLAVVSLRASPLVACPSGTSSGR